MALRLENVVAIDPGDRWVGLAVLRQRRYVRSVMLDCKGQTTTQKIQRIIGSIGRTDVIVIEEFRIRRAGYNAFAKGETLRLIGAIEYMAESVFKRELRVVPAAKPSDACLLWPALVHQQALFFVEGKDHCMSAWRILGAYAQRVDPELNQTLTGEFR